MIYIIFFYVVNSFTTEDGYIIKQEWKKKHHTNTIEKKLSVFKILNKLLVDGLKEGIGRGNLIISYNRM